MKRGMIIILIVIACIIIVVNIAGFAFKRKNSLEVERLLGGVRENEADLITEEDLEYLPDVVKKWLRVSNVIGNKPIDVARFKQSGRMRMAEGENWLEFESSQVFTVRDPGFVWNVDVRMNPALGILGRDCLIDGEGSMIIKLLGMVSVVDEKGPEVDQGSMVRYLAEMIWFPTAAISESITWEEIDDTSARARLRIMDRVVEAVFVFNDRGEVVDIYADRMMKKDDLYTMEKWHIRIDEYEQMDGFVIPLKGSVMWELDEGTFEWLQMEIIDTEYE